MQILVDFEKKQYFSGRFVWKLSTMTTIHRGVAQSFWLFFFVRNLTLEINNFLTIWTVQLQSFINENHMTQHTPDKNNLYQGARPIKIDYVQFQRITLHFTGKIPR